MEAPLPGSGFFSLLVSDPAPKEKRGFVVGMFADANNGGLAVAGVPPLGTPNNIVELPLATSPSRPRLGRLAPSPGLMPGDTDTIPLGGAPVGLLSLPPNTDGWFACVAVALEAGALPNGFVTGCAVCADELFEMPKLNMGFDDGSDAVASGGGWGVELVGLLVIPKLNFGFNASVPPTEGPLELGLELLFVEIAGLEGCENEKKP